MTSYIASLLTTTTSRVATLRQNLLPNENDGVSLEETHICRVLRAYYTEKGRNFPAWLPPDPKAPQVAPQQVVLTNNVGQNYGGGIKQTSAGKEMRSLWEKQQPRQQQQAPASNNPWDQPRQPREALPAPQQPEVKARQLPSKGHLSQQRDQNAVTQSKKDRLNERTGGGRSQSPSVSQRAQNQYGAAGNGQDYERRFMPKETEYSGTRRGGGAEKPFMAATTPWANSPEEIAGRQRSGGPWGANQQGQVYR